MMHYSPNREAFRIACIGHEIAHIRSLQACGFDMCQQTCGLCLESQHSTKIQKPCCVCTSQMFKITDFVHFNRLVVISRKHFTFTDRHYTTTQDNSGCQHCEIFMNVQDNIFFYKTAISPASPVHSALVGSTVFIIVGNNICIIKC